MGGGVGVLDIDEVKDLRFRARVAGVKYSLVEN